MDVVIVFLIFAAIGAGVYYKLKSRAAAAAPATPETGDELPPKHDGGSKL